MPDDLELAPSTDLDTARAMLQAAVREELLAVEEWALVSAKPSTTSAELAEVVQRLDVARRAAADRASALEALEAGAASRT